MSTSDSYKGKVEFDSSTNAFIFRVVDNEGNAPDGSFQWLHYKTKQPINEGVEESQCRIGKNEISNLESQQGMICQIRKKGKGNSQPEEVFFRWPMAIFDAAKPVSPTSVETSAPAEVRFVGPLGQPETTDKDVSLWSYLRHHAKSLSYDSFNGFLQACFDDPTSPQLQNKIGESKHFKYGDQPFLSLKAAAQIFVIARNMNMQSQTDEPANTFGRLSQQNFQEATRADVAEERRRSRNHALNVDQMRLQVIVQVEAPLLPYAQRIADKLFTGKSEWLLQSKRADLCTYPLADDSMRHPILLELIWSYWHEQSGMVQTISHVAHRYQNNAPEGGRVIANMSISTLRPISNLLWGYIQDAPQRLTPRRRALEYLHQYGLEIKGKAVGHLNPADVRTDFIKDFHDLLATCMQFFKEDSHTWNNPDATPILSALRALRNNLLLGTTNQFSDLTPTSRGEMLLEQWMLSQEPIGRYLMTNEAIPYAEEWMGPVDAMRNLMNWGATPSNHFNILACAGEVLLLSIRHDSWDQHNADLARAWAYYFRDEISNYVSQYRTVTGVDLGAETIRSSNDTHRYSQPDDLLSKKRIKKAS